MIQFLLNNQWQILEDVSPSLTILQWLRTKIAQTGTKEGCASGDCGACTVVIATLSQDDKLHYKAVNSCITFVASLHGKQLLTVEHLAQNGHLHIVQKAMVEHHASQCGFCTPGFVMSIFAMLQNQTKESITKHKINQALSGNLCRCTGYRPIIDAALEAASTPGAAITDEQKVDTTQKLLSMKQQLPHGELKKDEQRYWLPADIKKLKKIYREHPDTALISGGTDVALEVTQSLHSIPKILDLSAVSELQTISSDEDILHIGGSVSINRLMSFCQSSLPELAQLLERFAANQVRNQGTIAGNIANASPIGDLPPALIALNATLQVMVPDGYKTIPLEDFFIGYKQTLLPHQGIITQIDIPIKPKSYKRFYKISKRYDDDISAVCSAFCFSIKSGYIQSARIAYGGMAEIPKRALLTEQALVGQPFTLSGIKPAQQSIEQDFNPMSDLRASADYRLKVAQNLLSRTVYEYNQNSHLEAHYA